MWMCLTTVHANYIKKVKTGYFRAFKTKKKTCTINFIQIWIKYLLSILGTLKMQMDEERGLGRNKEGPGMKKGGMGNEMGRREKGWRIKKGDGEWNGKKRRGLGDEERGLGMKWEEEKRAGG